MKNLIFILLMGVFVFTVNAQDTIAVFQDSTEVKKWNINGYVSSMSSYMHSDLIQMEYLDNQIHNRLNIDWYPTSHLSASLQLRTRFLIGDQMRADSFNVAKKAMEDDFLSLNVAQGNMFVLNSMIDRLHLKYSIDKLDVTVGRQRINWGQTYVFNANDIFNAYSFVDFDYPERPGSDAVRIQYYPSYTSTLEAAVKYTNDSTITAAGLTRFSTWGYDFQFIAGLYNSREWVIGGGWSGNIKRVSFSGEFSYLQPNNDFWDSKGLLFASVNLNYSFPNSSMLQIEGFYNQYLQNNNLSFTDLMGANQDIKTLSLSEFTVFGGFTYPITSLIASNVSLMYYPDINGFLVFPSVDFSLSDELKLSLIAMYFTGDFAFPLPIGNKTGEMFYGFLRLKYGF